MSQSNPVFDTPAQSSEKSSPVQTMLGFITASWITRVVTETAELGLADFVKTGPKTGGQLARETKCHAPSLLRLLRVVTALGIFREDEKGQFHATALSAILETDSPVSLRHFARMIGAGEHYEAWGNLIHAVMTGETAFDNRFQTDVWGYYRNNPKRERIFQSGLMNITEVFDPPILSAYDFSGLGTIVDVAGGHGALLSAILRSNPHAKGILFDAPHVVESVGPRLQAEPTIAPRLRLVGGDFFKSLPRGGDAYILKWILHDWDDEKSAAILRSCRNAMGHGSHLLVIENLNDPGSHPMSKFMDLNMLVMTGGKERSTEDFKRLFRESGFKLNRVIPTDTPFSIVEALPVALT